MQKQNWAAMGGRSNQRQSELRKVQNVVREDNSYSPVSE